MRTTVCVLVLLLSLPLQAAGPDLSGLQSTFEQIIRTARGEVGVGLVHVETGARISINGDRRFPMASVYKLPIAVELLAQVAQGSLRSTARCSSRRTTSAPASPLSGEVGTCSASR